MVTKKRSNPRFCEKHRYHLLSLILQVIGENDIIVQNLLHTELKAGAENDILVQELGVPVLTRETLIIVSEADPDQILAGHSTEADLEEDLIADHVPETQEGTMVRSVVGIATKLVTYGDNVGICSLRMVHFKEIEMMDKLAMVLTGMETLVATTTHTLVVLTLRFS